MPPTKRVRQFKDHDDFFAEAEKARDHHRFETAAGSNFKKIFTSTILFFTLLAGVSWAGFFFFSSSRNLNISDKISLKITGPKNVKSGELVTYTINLANNSATPLGFTNLALKLPKNFVVSETIPSNASYAWTLGALSPGKNNQVALKGVFLGSPGDKLSLQATLTYRPGNFNAEFQNVDQTTISIEGSVFDLNVTAPTTTPASSPVALTLKYKNNSSNIFKEVQLRVNYPANFVPAGSSPTADDTNQNQWTLDQVAAGASGEITINGSFLTKQNGPATFLTSLGFLDETTTFKKQVEAQNVIKVGPAGLNTIMNIGQTGLVSTAIPGDQIEVSIIYQNAGAKTIKNVVLEANFAEASGDQIIDWAKLKNNTTGVIQNGTITWNKKQLPSLAALAPQKTGSLNFILPILPTPLPATPNYNYKINATTTITSLGNAEQSQTATSPTNTIFLVSYVEINPKVTKIADSTIRVTYTIGNTLHDLANLNLETTLPEGVTWTGSTSIDAGDIRFDPTQNKINWTLNWLPVSIKQVTLNFDLSWTGKSSPRSQPKLLTTPGSLTAIDKINNQPVSFSVSSVVTQ